MVHLPIVACDEPFERLRLCKICRFSDEIDGSRRCSRVVAESPALREALAQASVVAASDASVVISGETGTGKEVIARLLHANSRRDRHPFVAVNVGALPPELLESELFGHVRGAFTGAITTTPGLFGEADEGTLLLDEIGEMPLSLQVKLLRVLQEREVRRVGEPRARKVNVRVLCATHRDLRALVSAGHFREDLYYRLRVFSLELPPLRARIEDIVPLAQMAASRLGVAQLKLTPAARRALQAHAWPGNVRELNNAIEHALAFAQGQALDVNHLPAELRATPASDAPTRGAAKVAAASPSRSPAGVRPLADVEREYIQHAIAQCAGNQARAAKLLGIGRSTLWRKLQA